eukprot:TRINITY_DN23043_c0_g1_i1.p1 TRINITY_DN23043_c0_g1~~TRINITY_DN23043_c0_g1_i1.p1  ORF type:complete len:163 (+),score=37.57 TRINITY_DN23043_c0_g1_i1:24-512(+)
MAQPRPRFMALRPWWCILAAQFLFTARAKTTSLCATCQCTAHLLVAARKTMSNEDAERGQVAIVSDLFTNRTTHVCNEEKLKPYADYLELKVGTMVKKCNSMVPEDFNYKSAQDLRNALVHKEKRSKVAKLLCIDSTRCESLWSREEEPWTNWKSKSRKDEM